MPLSEHVYCVAVTLKMTERVEQRIHIKFCIKLEHSSTETIWMTQKAAAMGNCWLAALSWQCTCSCITSHAEFFGKTSNYPGDWAPLLPRFGTLWLLAFPKSRIIFVSADISDHWWNSGKYDGAAGGDWENCVRSQGAYFERDFVLCTMFLYLVFSSINVSIFHITWLDTFWTDLTFMVIECSAYVVLNI